MAAPVPLISGFKTFSFYLFLSVNHPLLSPVPSRELPIPAGPESWLEVVRAKL